MAGKGKPGRTPPALLYAPGVDYVAGLFGCFYAGVSAVPAFPPGTTRLHRTMSRLRMVSRYRATIPGGPNFAYDLCVRRAKDAGPDGVDLSSVELAFTGAEPVRPGTLERFAGRFEPCGFRAESFYPCYGLAEATLFVTGGRPLSGWRAVPVARGTLELEGTARSAAPAEPARKLVGCGTPGPAPGC
jgi:acyl-CoA synthetase (AMP-forming)/AMP-acid ligase II